MKNQVEVTWKEDMAFNAEINGHQLVMDAVPEVGGKDKGPRPKRLIISFSGRMYRNGCYINLKKMKVNS